MRSWLLSTLLVEYVQTRLGSLSMCHERRNRNFSGSIKDVRPIAPRRCSNSVNPFLEGHINVYLLTWKYVPRTRSYVVLYPMDFAKGIGAKLHCRLELFAEWSAGVVGSEEVFKVLAKRKPHGSSKKLIKSSSSAATPNSMAALGIRWWEDNVMQSSFSSSLVTHGKLHTSTLSYFVSSFSIISRCIFWLVPTCFHAFSPTTAWSSERDMTGCAWWIGGGFYLWEVCKLPDVRKTNIKINRLHTDGRRALGKLFHIWLLNRSHYCSIFSSTYSSIWQGWRPKGAHPQDALDRKQSAISCVRAAIQAYLSQLCFIRNRVMDKE